MKQSVIFHFWNLEMGNQVDGHFARPVSTSPDWKIIDSSLSTCRSSDIPIDYFDLYHIHLNIPHILSFEFGKNTNRIGLIGPMLRQLIARGSHGNPSVGSAFKIDMLISNRFVELGLFLATGWHFWHVLTRPPSAKTRGKNPISSRKFGPKNVALLLKFNIWKKCSGWTGEWKEFQLSWRSRRRDGADKEAERGECRRQVPSRGWIIPG